MISNASQYIRYSILISTRNRLVDLKVTLKRSEPILARSDVECLIYDDASSDGTSAFVAEKYPQIKLTTFKTPQGYIKNRNDLLAEAQGEYAISLDDDSHIVNHQQLDILHQYFQEHSKCAVIAFRIFWGLKLPENLNALEKAKRVKAYVGCGHVWRLRHWHTMPPYPEWFEFYGEEKFASYQLFKQDLEVHYVQEVLVHHRVDMKARKKDKSYFVRNRRSLRSGWYLYLLFFPKDRAYKKIGSSIVAQLKKVFKGNLTVLKVIFLAFLDVLNNQNLIKNSRNRLSAEEYELYLKLPESRIYWKPKVTSGVRKLPEH